MRRSAPPSAPPAPEPASGLPRGRMALLFASQLVIAAGNTAQQSVMPAIGTALGIADVWVSLAFSWSAVLWMTCAPIWARRSDRRGRKAMMALGLVGFILALGLGGLALWAGLAGLVSGTAALLLFACARTFYGLLGSAAPPAAQAYVASRTPPEHRTRALALMASAFGLGTVLGPAIAPLANLPGLGLVSSFAVFTLGAVAMLVLLRWRLPDDSPTFPARGQAVAEPAGAAADTPSEPVEPHVAGLRLSWFDRRLRAWLAAGLLGVHAQAMAGGMVGFLVLDRLDLRADPVAGSGPIGLVMMSGAAATLLAQWGLIPILRPDPRASCAWGMATAAAGIVLLAFAQTLHPIVLAYALFSLGLGLFRPGYTAGASLAVTREEQGQVAGVVTSINGSAFVVAPAIAVWLYSHAPLIGFAAIEACCLLGLAASLRAQNRDAPL